MNYVVEQMMKSPSLGAVDDNQRFREAMQRITLAGLYRGGFFTKAAFYGGTALRLFHGLPRFSEDMDFSLLQKDISFDLEQYFPYILEEFHALDMEVFINRKAKNKESAIESAFLKSETDAYDLEVNAQKIAKVKIEVDTNPPLNFQTENKVSLLPFSFMTKCYKLPYLFAGKMHALLYRNWKTRVKGRDWFDFEWYVRNNVPMDFAHFAARVKQLTPEIAYAHTPEYFKAELKQKIIETDIDQVKKDVAPFIQDQSIMNIWSRDYFAQIVDLIQFEHSDR